MRAFTAPGTVLSFEAVIVGGIVSSGQDRQLKEAKTDYYTF